MIWKVEKKANYLKNLNINLVFGIIPILQAHVF